MSMRFLHDSVASNFAVINAFSRLVPRGEKSSEVPIEPGAAAGLFLIRGPAAADCQGFQMRQDFLYPERYFYSVMFRVTADAGGKLAVQEFAVEIDKLPAA